MSFMLSVDVECRKKPIIPSVVILSVVMLSVLMVSVLMLSVLMLSVVAPFSGALYDLKT